MTTQPLPQDNSNPSNLPQPGQSPEIPDIPPATVPEQQPDSLPEPLGPDIPDRPDPAPEVPMPEEVPRPLSIQKTCAVVAHAKSLLSRLS